MNCDAASSSPLLGGAAAWPLAARAQQAERMRRIGVLMGAAETALSRRWLATFLHRLDDLGWREGRNLVTQVQWWNDQPEQMRTWAAELIARSPDVALTYTNLALAVLKPIAGNVPIVFVGVGDPVGGGFVSSLARPHASRWRSGCVAARGARSNARSCRPSGS